MRNGSTAGCAGSCRHARPCLAGADTRALLRRLDRRAELKGSIAIAPDAEVAASSGAVAPDPVTTRPGIPLNALDRHLSPMAHQLAQAAAEVIASGCYVLGPNVEAFEHEFAHWCGSQHCVGVANGSDALELGLRSLGISAGSVVAVAANAAMYGTIAVLACGAEPVFVEVDPVSLNMDPDALETVASGRSIDAVIVTHLYGRLADMDAILAVACRHGFDVFEDCAQAHGARAETGRMAGSFGKAASFSFYPTKNLGALGDGGAVVTGDRDTATTLRKLRQYGWSSRYTHDQAGGRNSRLDELQAAFLRRMLPQVDGWNRRRRRAAGLYSAGIRNARIQVPAPAGADFVAHLYVVQTDDRDGLQAHLARAGVGSGIHYPTPDHRQPLFRGAFESTSLPVTEAACGRVLTLPCFPELADEEIGRVIDACNTW